jgi:hypothetical protein
VIFLFLLSEKHRRGVVVLSLDWTPLDKPLNAHASVNEWTLSEDYGRRVLRYYSEYDPCLTCLYFKYSLDASLLNVVDLQI